MLQSELQSLQKVLKETERSHSGLVEDKKALDIMVSQLKIENAALKDAEESIHSGSTAEV